MNLSAVENARLKKCHPNLVRVIRRAALLTKTPFRVIETTRTVAQQRKNIANGVSWTMRSRHLPSKDGLSRAADIIPIIDGKPSWNWPVYHPLAKTIFQAAKLEKVKVEWGANWLPYYSPKLGNPADGVHWQLPWKEYP